MRSRRFRKVIQVWQNTAVSDSYGGSTITPTKISDTWADIRTVNKKVDLSDYGLNNSQLAVEVTVRKRSDFSYNSSNQFIIYNGQEYTIVGFPTNTNFDNSTITFLAVKEKGGTN